MTNVTAQMVKDLREKTGAGMMDCKAALGETSGDVEAAVDWLRKKGLAKAAKKAGRVAAEGLVGVAVRGVKGVVVEVNSETDFVARNDLFQGLVKMIADVALDVGADVETIKAAKIGSVTVADAIAETIAKVGENMTLRRAASLSVGKGAIGSYVHNSVIDGLGKLGVIVALESTGKADELASLGRLIAQHVAAANPQAIEPSGLDPALVAREKDVLAEKFKAQGKPANVIEKIVEFGAQDLLQGGLPARSALHPRAGQERRAGSQGGREDGRRAGQDHRLRALRARRGHRAAGVRFRRRGRSSRRSELMEPAAPRRGRHWMAAKPAYRRAIVKVSGEALCGPGSFGIHQPTIDRIAKDLIAARALGVTLGVVVGGGNILRGVKMSGESLSRPTADSMGMLATVMNALVLEAAIERLGAPARTMSALAMPQVCETYERQRALRHFDDEPRRRVRRRHRQSVLHHRHHGGAARRRNGLRCGSQGHQRRWNLQRRSEDRTPRPSATTD